MFIDRHAHVLTDRHAHFLIGRHAHLLIDRHAHALIDRHAHASVAGMHMHSLTGMHMHLLTGMHMYSLTGMHMYSFTFSVWCRTGEATEAAFRARHRWAARRVAHLLKGLPDRPPLQAASEVLESASVNVGLIVDGRPFLGSSVDVVSASGGLEGNPCSRLLGGGGGGLSISLYQSSVLIESGGTMKLGK